MARTLSVKNLYSQRFTILPIKGLYESSFGQPSDNGIWLIYGKEKNGKTTFALQLADYLSTLKRVLYISGQGRRIKMRCPVKVLTGIFHPILLSAF
ncbi:hypothetical protein HMPREF1214_04169 [Bacteroides sp. HPS0048]|uniref:hypothetical protein n=1 Tax=Bacteroides sp. HPS0048 TaxID=1078089 RepID=UPI00036B368D|nr:hypothetical protein [Bacteroides sp. HPS0048]EOA54205.1 hypothetical protein HMPREF1214_04169 [Bacteroides sp. HPS0048]